ncbi:hypothetical protein [Luteolibacter sp. Populi]|uniref:hypothetical protein n=1 Tax=Luteolibacter sp. Populi TaxID=3230487 RepID=UPI003466CC65
MGHYIRVLSTAADCIPLEALQGAIKDSNLLATLAVEAGDSRAWEQLVLSHSDGREIASIERNPVEEDSLGSEELEEFAEEISEAQPTSAARWLLDYFPRVKCIYAFQLLSGTDHLNGWEIFGTVKDRLWSNAPSIIQADNEGFSNEDGYHILWQFSDSVEGDWSMAILKDHRWIEFQMDLGDSKQRAAFLRGEVPDGVKSA